MTKELTPEIIVELENIVLKYLKVNNDILNEKKDDDFLLEKVLIATQALQTVTLSMYKDKYPDSSDIENIHTILVEAGNSFAEKIISRNKKKLRLVK